LKNVKADASEFIGKGKEKVNSIKAGVKHSLS